MLYQDYFFKDTQSGTVKWNDSPIPKRLGLIQVYQLKNNHIYHVFTLIKFPLLATSKSEVIKNNLKIYF
jgi:hypothetical protein